MASNESPTRKQRLLALAFGLLAVGAVAGAVLGSLWRIGLPRTRVSLAQLGPEDRQRLVEEASRESPGVFQAAWFEPRVGYTLRPGAKLAAWNDAFTANRLGYRSHPAEKEKGTFRVVFLGDSWTYGMGVRWRDSFPMQFERMANQRRPAGAPRVEAWSLALPGYNTLNELAALEFFFDRLRPDAVVLCPTPNDIDSSNAVTPEGMLARPRTATDDFGDPVGYRFFTPLVDAPSFDRRWRFAFSEVARAERQLRGRKVPFFLFFAATWDDALAHGLVAESGIQSPYAITPAEITVGKWRNPPPFRHGTPEANRLYGRLVYELVGGTLGWPALSAKGEDAAPESDRIYRSPPAAEWRERRKEAARKATAALPTAYSPAPQDSPQCQTVLAAMDCETGIAPKATSFLLRRAAGASEIVVRLRRLPGPTSLYPLAVQALVTDDREVVRGSLVLREAGPEDAEVVLRSPHGSSAAIEVTLLAERATASPTVLAGRSFVVARIEQRP